MAILWKYDEKACALHSLLKNAPITIWCTCSHWPTIEESPCRFWQKSGQFWKTNCVFLSEMARNAIESDFRSSKMAAGGHFVKKNINKSCVLIWNGEKWDRKWFSVIRTCHFVKKNLKKIKIVYYSEMAIFGPQWYSKISKIIESCVLIWNCIKLACINKHLSHVKCNCRCCPDCYLDIPPVSNLRNSTIVVQISLFVQ